MVLQEGLLLVAAVALMSLIPFNDSKKNLSGHPELLTGSLVNITINETYLYPSNDEPRKTKMAESINKQETSLDLNSNYVEPEKYSITTSKKLHHGHKKHHEYGAHHEDKSHKNSHHIHGLSHSTKLTKKHRDDPGHPQGYLPKASGEDWSCGVELNLLCCPPIKETGDVSPPTSIKFPCRCRCNELPVNNKDTSVFVPHNTSSDNSAFPFCMNDHRGWATDSVVE